MSCKNAVPVRMSKEGIYFFVDNVRCFIIQLKKICLTSISLLFASLCGKYSNLESNIGSSVISNTTQFVFRLKLYTKSQAKNGKSSKQACCAGCRPWPFTAEAPPIGKIHQFSRVLLAPIFWTVYLIMYFFSNVPILYRF